MIAFPEHGVRTVRPTAGSVTVRLFGSVDIIYHRRELEVGPPQRRAVLAALAVEADNPVPLEVLVHRVWGGSPPDGARAALHAHIARLRRVLAQPRGNSVRLTRRTGGYVLEIDPEDVDLHRFQRLLEHAREPGCSELQRTRLLREVLAIWRGEPLAGVPGDWAGRVRARVETQLISAAVDWARLELRAGRAEVAIDRLSQLTSLHPLSEPLAAALIRALCTAGRQAEALQHYASIRIHLREELGAEPGPELSGLHTAILRGEPTGAGLGPAGAPAASTDASARRRPRQLPASPPGFTGRQPECVVIERVFAAAARDGWMPVVAINGCAGAGKSALAIHAAHKLADRFPDGQLYVDLSPPAQVSTAEILRRFLRALGVPACEHPTEVEEAAALFRALVADQRLLVVLDNARDVDQLRPLSPATPGCGMLVTSRRVLVEMDFATHVHVDALSEPAAVEMLSRLVGPARIAAERSAAAEVARWCGHLPLALRAAGAKLAARPGWPVEALADRLRDEGLRLNELDFAEFSVRRALACSYQELTTSADPVDRSAAAVLTRLGARIPGPMDRQVAAQLLGSPTSEVEPLLERLVDARLLESPAPGCYRMPDLVRLYARQRRDDGASR